MNLQGWDKDTSPYHQGEQELHDRLGRKERQEMMARRIHRPFMPDQHREFFAQLPFIVAGSVDEQSWPWASILFGEPGFISTPDDKTLNVNAGVISGDPFWGNVEAGSPVGFVGIELPTRRRNRLNGVVKHRDENHVEVGVVQSYGNCPQYIFTRDTDQARDPNAMHEPEISKFSELPETAVEIIRNAETFFVASHNDKDDKYDTGGVDANHRGGKAGFVRVDGQTLTIPDYIGNFAFNTFGNFLVNPKAGLLFIDFKTGDIVQLTGTVELIWEPTDEIRAFEGAERAWKFHLDHGHILKSAAPYVWNDGEHSERTLMTGTWQES
ncbi:MAG: pyridoxamine 5'-phosphate oxidase family protein [Pseudomonadota bacterium]